MNYFLDTVESISADVGFSLFDSIHVAWLLFFLAVTVLNCIWFCRMDADRRQKWKKAVALLLIADELFKVIMLIIGGRYLAKYLPLHLCSINIFLIVIHAWKPVKVLNSFLYAVCIPGALAALLFPSWTSLPLQNFMHLHSFTVHILLVMYPVVLTAGGELKPRAKDIPACLFLLIAMAFPIVGINFLLDTNFMFLMYPEEGNPLMWFAQKWGNHLYGFPVLISAILLVMYLPVELIIIVKRKREQRIAK